MSTHIQAKLTKKRWLAWANERLHQEQRPVEVSEIGLVVGKLKELKAKHPQALSYEVSDVSIADAATAIVLGASRLNIASWICVVGDPLDPAVFHLSENGLEQLLREGAESEKTLALAPTALDGILVVDMPAIIAPSELLVSGCGSMEKLIPEIQLSVPGGALFRGN